MEGIQCPDISLRQQRQMYTLLGLVYARPEANSAPHLGRIWEAPKNLPSVADFQ